MGKKITLALPAKDEVWKFKKYVCRAKLLDLRGGKPIVILNQDEAHQNDIYMGHRVVLQADGRKTYARVDLSDDMVKIGEIGLFGEVADELKVKEGQAVLIHHTGRPESIEYIKNKIDGKELAPPHMRKIIDEVMDDSLSEGEMAAFMSACYIRGMTDNEVVGLTDAIVATGSPFHVGKIPVVDKHCIGGVAGNRTTMVIVPIMAAAGAYMPKSSSRSITSAAGTADTMETICEVSLPIEEMERQVRKVGGCVVWGGAINLAAADDKLIKIRNPLSLDPKGVLLASILAKKKSVGAQYCIIDIPIGRGVKVQDAKEAQALARDFIGIGKRLGIEIEAMITDGSEPIGRGIGPALECRDVLRALENKDHPHDLKEKSCQMAGVLLELCGKAQKGRGYGIAMQLIENGKALAKFKEIVEWQGGNVKKLTSDSMDGRIGSRHHTVKASAGGKISHIDNKLMSKIARAAGAPADKGAGIFLRVHRGDVVKAGDSLFDIFSESESKLDFAIKALEGWEAVELEKVVLDRVR